MDIHVYICLCKKQNKEEWLQVEGLPGTVPRCARAQVERCLRRGGSRVHVDPIYDEDVDDDYRESIDGALYDRRWMSRPTPHAWGTTLLGGMDHQTTPPASDLKQPGFAHGITIRQPSTQGVPLASLDPHAHINTHGGVQWYCQLIATNVIGAEVAGCEIEEK